MQMIRRTQALEAIVNPRVGNSIHFSSLFTLDRNSTEALRAKIAGFEEKTQKAIHKGGTDELYILNVDFFAPAIGQN